MTSVNLKPFTRPGLDVLFLALNPPEQSNANGHYFSGTNSAFFKLLFQSGLISQAVPKLEADDVVFGDTNVNHKGSEFGIMDLVEDFVMTHSGKVRPQRSHVGETVGRIHALSPRFLCVIHSKVRDALNAHAGFTKPLTYGINGAILPGSNTNFVLNYFPNGNAITDATKIEIFSKLKALL
jgi:hypothetical protein